MGAFFALPAITDLTVNLFDENLKHLLQTKRILSQTIYEEDKQYRTAIEIRTSTIKEWNIVYQKLE